MCCTLSQKEPDVSQTSRRMAFYQVLSTNGIWSDASAKTKVRSHTVSWDCSEARFNKRDKRLLLQMMMITMSNFRQEMDEDGSSCFFSQTLDQDLWVVGDRSREEGVPSRFGRGTGMCPLIRLGNCGGRETGWELAGRGRRLYESCFPVRNCSIVTALVSCFVFFFSCFF